MADDKTKVLEQATDLVLKIALDLDQQRSARQQCLDRVAIKVLDTHFLEPAGLHDACDASRIVAVVLVDLHLQHRFCMASIDTDYWQVKPRELGPKPSCCRSSLKADPNRTRRFRPHEPSNRFRDRIDDALSDNRPLSGSIPELPNHHTAIRQLFRSAVLHRREASDLRQQA